MQEVRASILGAWVGLESLASAFVSPVVAYLSQDVFGYTSSALSVAEMAGDERERNASALASALLYTMIIPWIPCFFVYTAIHWTYARDKASYEAEEAAQVQRGTFESPVGSRKTDERRPLLNGAI